MKTFDIINSEKNGSKEIRLLKFHGSGCQVLFRKTNESDQVIAQKIVVGGSYRYLSRAFPKQFSILLK